MLYRPQLPNGKSAPLHWTLALCRLTNNIIWPLEDNATWLAYLFDRFCWLSAFLIYVATNEAQIRYLRLNFYNLDDFMEGIPTFLITFETYLRGFTVGLKKEKFKKLLQKFYAEIYIEESTNPKLYKQIQRQFVLIYIISVLYMCSLMSYVVIPIYLLSTGRRELLYKMIPAFDFTPLYYYIPCILSNIWLGFIVATLMYGEPSILSLLLFHLTARYQMMRDKLNSKVEQLLKSSRNNKIAAEFHEILVSTIQENKRLNQFAHEIQEEYSFRLFCTFSFLAVSLCILGFKVYTSPVKSIPYVFWTVGKVQETIAYGQMGTAIQSVTDSMSSMYYESKWEAVIQQSSDNKANVRLMKLVNLAILINSKPLHLTGLNFFNISLTGAVKILQGASSYFTSLISFRA